MNKFKIGDKVVIIVGQAKGMEGIICHIIPPNPERDENSQYAYLVKFEDGNLPWYAESELKEAKEAVIFT